MGGGGGGAGLNSQGVSPNVAVHSYSTAVKCVLLYGCNTMNITMSYRFIQANQRNLRTILYWTSQISFKVTFSSKNNLGE